MRNIVITTFLILVMMAGLVIAQEDELVLGTMHLKPCMRDQNYPFYCINIAVPINHNAPTTSPQMNVLFFVMPASNPPTPRRAMFVPMGGPGVVASNPSGASKWYLSGYDSVGEQYDRVYMDLRGTGNSCGSYCAVATRKFFDKGYSDITGSWGFEKVIEEYITECQAELDDPAQWSSETCILDSTLSGGDQRRLLAKYLSTTQAAHDVEAFRVNSGYEKWTIYGHSYGSQLAQAYAALYPAHMEALVLDSNVDNLANIRDGSSLVAIEREDAARHWGEYCWENKECRRDCCPFGKHQCRDLLVNFLAPVRGVDVIVPYHLGNGTVLRLRLSRWLVEYQSLNWMWSPSYRSWLVRMAEQASRGNWVPFVRQWLYGRNLQNGLHDVNAAAYSAGSYSDWVYYAISSNDYSMNFRDLPFVSHRDRVRSFLQSEDGRDALRQAFGTQFAADAPMGWLQPENMAGPAKTHQPSPTSHSYPILVVTSNTDPVTAPSASHTIYERYLKSQTAPGLTHLVIVEGGAHSSWGYTDGVEPGLICLDNIISNLLNNGQAPQNLVSRCKIESPLAGYIPLPPIWIRSSKQSVQWTHNEVLQIPEAWDMSGEEIGCDYGGTVSFTAITEEVVQVELNKCDMLRPSYPATGTALWNFNTNEFTMDSVTIKNKVFNYHFFGNGTIVVNLVKHLRSL